MTESAVVGIEGAEQELIKPAIGVPIAIVEIAAALVFFKKSLLFTVFFMVMRFCVLLDVGLESRRSHQFNESIEILEVGVLPRIDPGFAKVLDFVLAPVLRFEVLWGLVFD